MIPHVYILAFTFVTIACLPACAQKDPLRQSNQQRIEDLRQRLTNLSNGGENTDSLILLLKQIIRQQSDSLRNLTGTLDRYQHQSDQFSYSPACNCHRIYYANGKHTARYAAYAGLDSVASVMRKDHTTRLTLVGHADKSGTASFNEALALKRAEDLKLYFINQHHLDPARITTETRGNTEAIPGISDPYLFHLNRRVEVFVVKY